MKKVSVFSIDMNYRKLLEMYFVNKDISLSIFDTIENFYEEISTNPDSIFVIDIVNSPINHYQLLEVINNQIKNASIYLIVEDFMNLNISKLLDNNVADLICKSADLYLLEYRLLHHTRNTVPNNMSEETFISNNDNIILNSKQQTVHQDDKSIRLTKTEFDLLKYFMSNKNCLLVRNNILETVWCENIDDPTDIRLRKVDTYIKLLRKKIHISSIQSVRGIGYRWVE